MSSNANGNMGESSVFMLLVKVVGSIISVGRTIDAAVTIHRYRNSWNTLPFISPVLWLDWIGIYDLVNQFARPCAIIAGIVGTCLYGIASGMDLQDMELDSTTSLIYPVPVTTREFLGRQTRGEDIFFCCIMRFFSVEH